MLSPTSFVGTLAQLPAIDPQVWLFLAFGVFVIVVMLIDLALTRNVHQITPARALAWTGVCVTLALAFVPALYAMYDAHWLKLGLDADGKEIRSGFTAAAEYLQGWLLEYALSVDNLFVFALIFKFFKVPRENQHRVLTWGIIATLILRGLMILAGTVLISNFEWVLWLAGAFLVYTGFKMLVAGDDDGFNPETSRIVRWTRRILPFTNTYHAQRFFAIENGRRVATPLFLVLVVLNIVDIVFAVDSIPAIFGVTKDVFIVFTSNVFAVLGLRALYFVLARMMDQFKYLKVSLAVVLAFIGVKMLTEHWVSPYVPRTTMTIISLGFIVVSIGLGIVFSLRAKPKPLPDGAAGIAEEPLPLGERDAT